MTDRATTASGHQAGSSNALPTAVPALYTRHKLVLLAIALGLAVLTPLVVRSAGSATATTLATATWSIHV